MLSATGVRVNVFDYVEAYGHGGHGDGPSCPQRLGLELRERLVVQHEQLLPVQLDMSAKRRRRESRTSLAQSE